VSTKQADPRPRYEQEWGTEFWQFVDRDLKRGSYVLDVGSGRTPTVAPERRAPGTRYAGLDISAEELAAAPPGSYHETIVADVETPVPTLAARFDLIVSWQALEHVSDLLTAAQALCGYLKPGGALVACLSGRNAVFALANRMLPEQLAERLVAWTMRRPRETVFPARYDRCDARGLRAAFAGFEEVEVVPLWRAATYFDRFPLVKRVYLSYEDWAVDRGHQNLATHYIVAARKGQ
jgi:2-polyprenyl-6-hydroxyphenyl methylase/3-demethylubiquinone-9 3-methyltransferase